MNDIEKAAIDWLNCERENYSKDGVYYYFMNLAISALEKQVAKKGIPYDSSKNHKLCECSVCNKDTDLYYNYCPNCGQKIDWGK